MRSTQPQTPNALNRDIQNVVSDAQELLKTVQSEGESKLTDIKGHATAQLGTATHMFGEAEKVGEVQQSVQGGAAVAMNETHQYVRANPWASIGIGVAIGAVIGYLAALA